MHPQYPALPLGSAHSTCGSAAKDQDSIHGYLYQRFADFNAVKRLEFS